MVDHVVHWVNRLVTRSTLESRATAGVMNLAQISGSLGNFLSGKFINNFGQVVSQGFPLVSVEEYAYCDEKAPIRKRVGSVILVCWDILFV